MAYSQSDADVRMNDGEGDLIPLQQGNQTPPPSNSNDAGGQLPAINPDASMDLSGIGASLNEASSLVDRGYDSEVAAEALGAPPLRVNSLVLASFPWYTSLPMAPTRIAQRLGEGHYGTVR